MRRGFTLIELLVVIAIIAILAAILFPVFARARAKAQQNNCLSNVKQMVLSCLMYCSDYDNHTILYMRWKNSAAGMCGTNRTWYSPLAPYTKNQQIFACPSTNNIPDPTNAGCVNYMLNVDSVATGIGPTPVNTWCDTGTPYSTTLISDLNAVNTAMCMDGWTGDGGWVCEWYSSRPAAGVGPFDVGIHNLGINVGFWDGHAKWVGANRLFFDYNGVALPAPAVKEPNDRSGLFGPNMWWTGGNE